MAATKFSRQREAIRENLRNRCDHPTADMIFQDIKSVYPNVSLGTVYRNLTFLVDRGEIIKLPQEDGSTRYDGDIQPHDHFNCRVCGSVKDLHVSNPVDLAQEAASQFDGIVESCSVTYYGVCADCRRDA